MCILGGSMSDKKTLVLIDGHALAFRQYYALERTAMKNSANEPTWAVYGFFKSIFDLLASVFLSIFCTTSKKYSLMCYSNTKKVNLRLIFGIKKLPKRRVFFILFADYLKQRKHHNKYQRLR